MRKFGLLETPRCLLMVKIAKPMKSFFSTDRLGIFGQSIKMKKMKKNVAELGHSELLFSE